MLDLERLNVYLSSLQQDNTPILNEIEKEALATYVPIIRKDMQQFLKVMLSLKQPRNILEVGTAVGFSAILMATYGPKDCKITTVENYEKRIPIARENFVRANVDDRVELLCGDAEEILPTLDDTYDFIFMDAAKGQYINFWPELCRLSKSGTVIITDNVLQDGDILESHFIVERRNRTIHKRMREYLYEISHDDKYETTILPVGDGVSITVVK